MNIEEADPPNAIRACGDRLVYFHASESNRGYLGAGTVDFDACFRALVEVGYQGTIGFEGFSASAVPEDFAVAMALWRDTWRDGVDLAVHARSFLARGLKRARV